MGSIGNNFIAATPGHPFILDALTTVTRYVLERQGDNIWFVSGPGAFSTVFCRHYAADLAAQRCPARVAVRTVYEMGQRLSMHLPRRYKQDARSWYSPKATGGLFRSGVMRLRGISNKHPSRLLGWKPAFSQN